MAKRTEIGTALKTLVFEGKVASGEGNGKRYLQLPWVLRQMEKKLGYTPFLGTLNLKLTKESTQHRKLLSKAKADIICPPEGYCTGLLFHASMRGFECAIVLPQIDEYAEDLLELVSPLNLREALNLSDGDLVTVELRNKLVSALAKNL